MRASSLVRRLIAARASIAGRFVTEVSGEIHSSNCFFADPRKAGLPIDHKTLKRMTVTCAFRVVFGDSLGRLEVGEGLFEVAQLETGHSTYD